MLNGGFSSTFSDLARENSWKVLRQHTEFQLALQSPLGSQARVPCAGSLSRLPRPRDSAPLQLPTCLYLSSVQGPGDMLGETELWTSRPSHT